MRPLLRIIGRDELALLQLQMILSEMIPLNRNEVAAGGNIIRASVLAEAHAGTAATELTRRYCFALILSLGCDFQPRYQFNHSSDRFSPRRKVFFASPGIWLRREE